MIVDRGLLGSSCLASCIIGKSCNKTRLMRAERALEGVTFWNHRCEAVSPGGPDRRCRWMAAADSCCKLVDKWLPGRPLRAGACRHWNRASCKLEPRPGFVRVVKVPMVPCPCPITALVQAMSCVFQQRPASNAHLGPQMHCIPPSSRGACPPCRSSSRPT